MKPSAKPISSNMESISGMYRNVYQLDADRDRRQKRLRRKKEDRVGFVLGRLIAVAFTEREPDSIRIISARKANKREEAHYKEAIADELGKN